MKKIFMLLALIASISLLSCKKSDIGRPPAAPGSPLTNGAAAPEGTPVSKLIHASTGGAVSSADGRLTVNIPAGALAADETISIQPITNNTGLAIGKNYRLTPHGIQFNAAVTISFNYDDAELTGTAPELLKIGFRDETGAWQAMKGTILDKPSKQIKTTATHFSDWGFFPYLFLTPAEARLGVNETIKLKVMYAIDDDLLGDLPSPGGITPILQPMQLQEQYVKRWIFNGTGSLTPTGSTAVYKAPARVPAQNPEAVNAEIKMARGGLFLLVSNITVLSEFHIDYLQVDETEVNVSNPPLNYVSRLFIYGNFGNDPGPNNRMVKLNDIPVAGITWTPKIIICEIPAIGPGSSGNVVVSSGGNSTSKLLNEWTVDLNYAKKESPDGSLTRKTRFVLRFRGDAVGYGSGETDPFLEYTDLNKSSKAIVDMPDGSYSNTVSQSTCGTYTVKWDAIPGYVTDRSLYSTGDGFSGRVYQDATGFGVKIKYTTDNILRSTRTFAPCTGFSTQQIVFEPITFEGYHEQTIWFNFSSQSARTSIIAGTPPLLNATGVAPGLFWDAGDLNSNLFNTRIWWTEATPKFD